MPSKCYRITFVFARCHEVSSCYLVITHALKVMLRGDLSSSVQCRCCFNASSIAVSTRVSVDASFSLSAPMYASIYPCQCRCLLLSSSADVRQYLPVSVSMPPPLFQRRCTRVSTRVSVDASFSLPAPMYASIYPCECRCLLSSSADVREYLPVSVLMPPALMYASIYPCQCRCLLSSSADVREYLPVSVSMPPLFQRRCTRVSTRVSVDASSLPVPMYASIYPCQCQCLLSSSADVREYLPVSVSMSPLFQR